MRALDLKDGKEIFHNGLDHIDESKPINEQHLTEDLMALRYETCLIDVGSYHGCLTIQVIEIINGGCQDWSHPFSVIKCFDIDDFYLQLQRAIDIYPSRIK